MEIKRRFSLPGSDYDYVVISADGDDVVTMLEQIHKTLFLTIAFQAYIAGVEYPLEQRMKAVETASEKIFLKGFSNPPWEE